MNVLLVDDEPLARRRLRRMLAEAGHVVVVAECGSGTSALEALRAHQVDLVFLDIQMPGVDGFVVADSLNGPDAPMVVFVTAYDSHALRAFETRALDYLLKPVRAERLAAALTRARETMAARRSAAYAAELRSVMARLDQDVPQATASAAPAPHAAARIEVRDGERVRYIDADDVAWAEAHGAHVKIHTKRGIFEIRETLARVESSLDPRRFVRIHRSYVVNVSQIRELEPWFGGDAVLHLQDGQRLKVSRTYRAQLKQRLNTL
ncbi:MAG: LytTR family DNA-binding domain-containing protein [Gemmatimonadaceae bacterium]